MEMLEKNIGYSFKNIDLLKVALTHSSYANENRCRSYERLEFLGDSVLSIIVSEYLFSNMRDNDEGDLSRIRASLVCEETLSELSSELNLGEYIYLGNGEEKAGSRNRTSILSDVFESTLAAIYLDSGMDEAKKFVFSVMKEKLEDAVKNKTNKDYKTRLQEVYQKKTHGRTKIYYKIISENGPEHMKNFEIELLINDKVISKGSGKTKKEAEQMAAKIALENQE